MRIEGPVDVADRDLEGDAALPGGEELGAGAPPSGVVNVADYGP